MEIAASAPFPAPNLGGAGEIHLSVVVRRAVPEDYADLEYVCANKTYYDSIFMNAGLLREFALSQLRERFSELQDTEAVQLFVAHREGKMVGFTVIMHGQVESITGEQQSIMFQVTAPDYEVLKALVATAREWTRKSGGLYLVVNTQVEAKKEQIWFYRLGFRPELNRTAKRIPAGHVGASSNRYVARPATYDEHLFIIRVNAAYCASYRPAGRETDLDRVRANFFSAYVNLDPKDTASIYLILEDMEMQQPAGYIIIRIHDLPMGQGLGFYNYDVAAAPEYAYRGLSLYLCGAGETEIGKRGGGVFYGDSNVENIKVINGDKVLGYGLDSTRWGYDCRPGAVWLPLD